MDFSVQTLSFFVIQTEGQEQEAAKQYKHYKTMDEEDYADSEIKSFLDGEFARIAKRKAEVNPSAENVPTKIGHFVVEPGHELTSNPNYNLLQRLRFAEDKEQFKAFSDEMLRMYMETSAVRGGAFIVVRAKLNRYFDEPFLFVLKCDFESRIARISDEKSLISRVEMAISARSIKSIQYPHMPEEGMLEERELKIHQASHARYFEDFLRFVSFEKSMPEIVNEQVLSMVEQYMESKWQEAEGEERQREEEHFELWACGDKRDLQEKWTHEYVMEAASHIVEVQPDLEMKFKLDGVAIRGKIADYGSRIHIGRMNGRYMVMIEGDAFEFEKGISPVELLQPEDLEQVLDKIKANAAKSDDESYE